MDHTVGWSASVSTCGLSGHDIERSRVFGEMGAWPRVRGVVYTSPLRSSKSTCGWVVSYTLGREVDILQIFYRILGPSWIGEVIFKYLKTKLKLDSNRTKLI